MTNLEDLRDEYPDGLKDKVIEKLRQHARFGCDKMETEVCDKLLWEIDSLFELENIRREPSLMYKPILEETKIEDCFEEDFIPEEPSGEDK